MQIRVQRQIQDLAKVRNAGESQNTVPLQLCQRKARCARQASGAQGAQTTRQLVPEARMLLRTAQHRLPRALADARAPAVLADAPAAVMLADASQSLHLSLCRLCWQMLVPPQSLQLLLWRLCWQMLAPGRTYICHMLRVRRRRLSALHCCSSNFSNCRPQETSNQSAQRSVKVASGEWGCRIYRLSF